MTYRDIYRDSNTYMERYTYRYIAIEPYRYRERYIDICRQLQADVYK